MALVTPAPPRLVLPPRLPLVLLPDPAAAKPLVPRTAPAPSLPWPCSARCSNEWTGQERSAGCLGIRGPAQEQQGLGLGSGWEPVLGQRTAHPQAAGRGKMPASSFNDQLCNPLPPAQPHQHSWPPSLPASSQLSHLGSLLVLEARPQIRQRLVAHAPVLGKRVVVVALVQRQDLLQGGQGAEASGVVGPGSSGGGGGKQRR